MGHMASRHGETLTESNAGTNVGIDKCIQVTLQAKPPVKTPAVLPDPELSIPKSTVPNYNAITASAKLVDKSASEVKKNIRAPKGRSTDAIASVNKLAN